MSQYHRNRFVICAKCLTIGHQCWGQSGLNDRCGINGQYCEENMFTHHMLG